jgi:hypothetical protein
VVARLADFEKVKGSNPLRNTKEVSMSATVESYDGLCGIIATFASSNLQMRCLFEMGHGGPCSFEKHRHNFVFSFGSVNRPDLEEEFINSVIYSLQKR